MPPVGFEHTISAGERPQPDALDRTATVTGIIIIPFPSELPAVQPLLKTVPVSLINHFLFTVLPKTVYMTCVQYFCLLH